MKSINITTPANPGNRWLIWTTLSVAGTAIAGMVGLTTAGCRIALPLSTANSMKIGFILSGTGFITLGILLMHHKPENRIGWLAGVTGSLQFILPFIISYNTCGLSGTVNLHGLPYTVWVQSRAGQLFGLLLFGILPQIFPTGRFMSPRWRNLTWIFVGTLLMLDFIKGFMPGSFDSVGVGLTNLPDNPFGMKFLPREILRPVIELENPLFAIMILFAITSQVVRYFRAKFQERQQLKWFAYFLGTVVLSYVLFLEIFASLYYPKIWDTIWFGISIMVVFTGFPLTIGIAIFKYRLYDIDLIIRRTLSYALLTGILALVYFGGVLLLQSIFRVLSGNPDSQAITVLSTLGIAALFNPLRKRIQTFIDRRFYRREYDAGQLLRRFAATTRDEVDLERLNRTLLNTTEHALQPEQLSLWLTSTEEKNQG